MNRAPTRDTLGEALGIIERTTGITTPPHRHHLVESALRRATRAGNLERGLLRLRRDNSAWAALISAITIGETYLFRHFGHYEALGQLAQRRKAAGKPCRVLSAGCATGEEAWSAAAVLRHCYGAHSARCAVVGWDIDGARIARARRGQYRSWSVRHGLKTYRRYFSPSDDGVLVGEQLRPFVSFEQRNLAELSASHLGIYDAIFFRNVAIYWSAERTAQVIAQFEKLLAKDGLLFVGPADPIKMGAGFRKRIEHDAIVFAIERVPSDALESRRTALTASRRRTTRRALPKAVAHTTPLHRRPATLAAPAPAPKPPDARPATERARSLADAGRYQDALEVLDGLDEVLSVSMRSLKAIVHLNLGDPQRAAKLFKECVFFEPSEPAHRQWLAVAYDSLGQTDKAQRQWTQAAEQAAAQPAADTTAESFKEPRS